MKKTNSGFAVTTHFQDKDKVVREIYDRWWVGLKLLMHSAAENGRSGLR